MWALGFVETTHFLGGAIIRNANNGDVEDVNKKKTYLRFSTTIRDARRTQLLQMVWVLSPQRDGQSLWKFA
jgi:hypothetical protein